MPLPLLDSLGESTKTPHYLGRGVVIEDWQTQRFAVSQYAEYRRRGIAERGKKNMAGYGSQITPRDRWAIVLYVKALLRSQNPE